MALDILFNIVSNITQFVSVLLFLITGISFGCIAVPNRLNREFLDKREHFIVKLVRGYITIGFLYFGTVAFFSMYYDYFYLFEVITSFLGMAVCTVVLVSIQQSPKGYHLHLSLAAMGILLTVKLAHTVYFSTIWTMKGIRDDTYNFLMMSLAFELILVSFCTIIPYVHIKEKDGDFHAFTIWGMEFVDLVSQIVVIQTYCRAHASDEWSYILLSYFVLFAVDLVIFVGGAIVLLSPFIKSANIKTFVAAHIIAIDTITDLPFFGISLFGKTFVGNVFIAIDMALKMALFVRAVIWVPCKLDKAVTFVEFEPSTIQAAILMECEGDDKDKDYRRMQGNWKGAEGNVNVVVDLKWPKCRKIFKIMCFLLFAGSIVGGFYFYLGWNAEQYMRTPAPTMEPTIPTFDPTPHPIEPTVSPTSSPTSSPLLRPTHKPTANPTPRPTHRPAYSPTPRPTTATRGWFYEDHFLKGGLFTGMVLAMCCGIAFLVCMAVDHDDEETHVVESQGPKFDNDATLLANILTQ